MRDTRPPILLDFESRSRCDLKKHGGRLYWEHPSTEALCCVLHDVATNTRAVWLPGDPCPVEPGDVLAAHNWRGFDRFAAHRVWGWPLDAEAIDTAELARRAGLPGSLDELGKRWLGRDKDMAASRFTVGLSTCRRPTKKTAHRAPLGEEITPAEWSRLSAARKRELGVLPEVTPEALARVIAYCESDVEIMVHGWPLLEPWLDAGHENEVLRVDCAINDRGIGFDSELARRLLEEDARNARRVLVQVGREIGMPADRVREIASSPAQFCEFTGADNAQKETVEDIAVNWPRRGGEHGRRAAAMARARQALASIARGKLEAGLNRVSPDGRLRDTHRYFGAHTGRWSHRGMQLGNMPRPADRFDKWSAEDIDRLAAEVIAGRHADAEEIDLLLRACLVARPGYTFAVRDFSGVEARALAWCADDRKALQVFASGVSPYKVMAGVIFGCDPDEVSKGEARYSVGKIAELACFGADTQVLTECRGWQPIAALARRDRVWDGVEWVEHAGVVDRGVRDTIDLMGVRVTPDHLIWSGEWTEARCLAREESTRSRALAIASASLPSRASSSARAGAYAPCGSGARADELPARSTSTTCEAAAPRGATCARSARRGAPRSSGAATLTSCRTTGTADDCATAYRRSCSAATTPDRSPSRGTGGGGSACSSPGALIAPRSCATSCRSTGGTCPSSTLTAATTIAGTSRAICVSSPAPSTKRTSAASPPCTPGSSSSRRVYDLAFAGPRNRFMIRTSEGPLLVHNCGYGMGAAKFKWTAAKMGADLDEIGVDAGEVVRAWRQLHAPIVRFWYAIEAAFSAAACGASARVDCFDFVPSEGGGPTRDVAIFLPSGRPIVYNDVRISRDAYGRPQLSYHGTKSREHTYGGKLTENVIQALCRDLLAAALVKCEDAGLDPVLDVHDEVVCEVPISAAAEGEAMLDEIMHDLPDWAEGFPVGAAGFVGRRYRK